jgi:hypothetical protein
MSIDAPFFPADFSWQNVKSIFEDWFERFLRGGNLTPPGVIAEFVGTTAPEGWVECDGTEYDWDKYPDLAVAVGVESSPGKFTVPTGTAVVGAICIIKV